MKKLFLVFLAIAATAGAYAQIDSTYKMDPQDKTIKQNQNVQINPVDKIQTDGVVMQNGKMMQVKNGETVVLDKNITLSNGTTIMTDGTYINKDGSKLLFKEGQHMDMSGNSVPNKPFEDKNLNPVPDSLRTKVNK